jgi:hypothetical protein
MCFTPCLSIISWKISPPVFPTNEWSNSVLDLRGCRSFHLVSSRLNAGLGTGRSCAAVAAVLFGRLDVSEDDLVATAEAAALFKGRCACTEVVENRRAHCVVRRAFRLPVPVSIARVGCVEAIGGLDARKDNGGDGSWMPDARRQNVSRRGTEMKG